MTPIDFWRNWWSSWFTLCQKQFALQGEIMALVFPTAAGSLPKSTALCDVPPGAPEPALAPAPRRRVR